MTEDSEPKVHVVDMESQKLLLDIAKVAEQSCVDRRIYEWRLNILLWGGIPAIIGFLAKEAQIAPWAMYVLLGAFIALWALYTFVWQSGVQTGHHTDRALKSVAMDKLLDAVGLQGKFEERVCKVNGFKLVLKDDSYRPEPIFGRGKNHWQYVYSAITFLILAISWILLFFVTK